MLARTTYERRDANPPPKKVRWRKVSSSLNTRHDTQKRKGVTVSVWCRHRDDTRATWPLGHWSVRRSVFWASRKPTSASTLFYQLAHNLSTVSGTASSIVSSFSRPTNSFIPSCAKP